ncbi:hypothetical protein QHC70_003699 [Citrobacter freundii]|nr:hypothetical protein [Citrobacter freundii]ELQ7945351.1 hypothetical protein [Citrobacter freundii]ELQ7995478.1 hypothetical protein [Citrobacter freundii]
MRHSIFFPLLALCIALAVILAIIPSDFKDGGTPSHTKIGFWDKEVSRVPQTNKVAIIGYDHEGIIPRTLVMVNNQPLLLNLVFKKEDADENLDLVRISNGRMLLCLHNSTEKCWISAELSTTPKA